MVLEQLGKNTLRCNAIVTEVQMRCCEGVVFPSPVIVKGIIDGYPREIHCS